MKKKPYNGDEIIDSIQEFLGQNIDPKEACIIGDKVFYDISLANKINALSIKVMAPGPFSLFKYGFSSENFVNIFLEVPYQHLFLRLYKMDPYLTHNTKLIMKKDLARGPLQAEPEHKNKIN